MKPLRAQTSRSRIALTALAVAMAGCGLPGADDDEELSMAGVETVQRALVSTTSAEYKLPAAVDPDVLGDRATELWARVYRPSSLVSGKKYPLIIFLHGNHYTCGRGSNPRIDDSAQYTNSGTCPSGYVVTPNHRGYEYIANELAGNEYIVVSINANRGITAGGGVSGDWGLNLARGRLILKHLYKLSRWNRNQEATPSSLGFSFNGRLDFQNVGMMGHSRGGEGIRAAYNQYIDWGSTWPAKIPDPVRIRGLFEIGPVDGQTDRVLDALDARWAVLLPMCDGDVSDLQGVKPFDRMVGYEEVETNELMKASFTVFGANHNFYNTEWQQSDSTGCFRHTPLFSTTATGSSSQRDTGRIPIVNFFRGSVGSTSNTYRKLFNPLYALPSSLTGITRIDRGYISASDIERYTKLEHFDNEAPLGSWFLPHTTSGVSISHDFLPEHDDNTRGGVIQWSSASSSNFWQTNFTGANEGIAFTGYRTLDIRLERAIDAAATSGNTDFSVQLVNPNGTLSNKIAISSYAKLATPGGGPFGDVHSMLQTARIPLKKFTGVNLASIRALRLTFDRTSSGKIYVTHIRIGGNSDDDAAISAASTSSLAAADADVAAAPVGPAAAAPARTRQVVSNGNQVVALRPVADSAIVAGRLAAGAMELELASPVAFPIGNALLVLQVGGNEVKLSRHPNPNDTRTVVFTLSPQQYAAARNGDRLTVSTGRGAAVEWDFGPLAKR